MNRDEALTRAEGEPRLERSIEGALRFWHTVDAASGGSWFGVRGDGLVAALLNRYQDSTPGTSGSAPLRSRGSLIPELLHTESGNALTQLAATLQPEKFAPFDLYVYQNETLQGLHWNGETLQLEYLVLNGPRLFTSSSQLADIVRTSRQREFERFALENPTADALRIFDALHLRKPDGDPALAIRMRRPGRATRSVCQAQVSAGNLQFRYLPLQA